jgi:hypothetical protein
MSPNGRERVLRERATLSEPDFALRTPLICRKHFAERKVSVFSPAIATTTRIAAQLALSLEKYSAVRESLMLEVIASPAIMPSQIVGAGHGSQFLA